mgnify:CR=1 FL=1
MRRQPAGLGLHRLGVRQNDTVACQLPNWWQFTLTYLACSRIGAVMNPLMHIFRERELSFMLNHGEAKVMIAPKTFRGFDFEAMVTGLQPSLPHLKHVVIVGGDGGNSFDALLSAPEWEKQADAQDILTRGRPGPDDVTQLIYTSGTTSRPKGVVLTHANMVFSGLYGDWEVSLRGSDRVKSTFLADMGQLFATALQADGVEGIILNPWNRTLMLEKELIRIILGQQG